MQNLGARLKYTEQYCMSIITAASCSLGSKPPHACIQGLTSQSVKGYHKNAHGMAANIHTLRIEKKPASSVKSSPVSGARKVVAVTSVFATVPKVHAPRVNNTYIPYIACDTQHSIYT